MTRDRSHWGWGWADRFQDRETRLQLAQMGQALLGFSPPGLSDPVPLDAVELPPSRLTVPASLGAFVGADRDSRIRHTWGRSWPDLFAGYHGRFAAAPDAVARPRTEAEVVDVLAFAAEHDATVVPYGGGTSVVGGVNAGEARRGDRPVITLSTAALAQVLEVDETSLTARVQAGIFGPALEEALQAKGVTLRHFPQSFEFSTLGGWIATRAGGHFATLYTHIDDLVAATTTVTPSGRIETRRLPGSGAGPSPDRLILGSEGSLGVITEAWLRVRRPPVWRGRADVLFDDYEAAVRATRGIAQAGLYPSNCRLLDRREALLNQVPADGGHVLLLGFESADHPVEGSLRRALELAEGEGGRCPGGPKLSERKPGGDTEERGGADAVWRQAFFDGPYLQSTLVSLGVIADTFETACPWDRFEELHARVVREVRQAMKDVCGTGFLSCRFTHVYPDGPAPYFTWIAPGREGAELEQWRTIKQAAMDAVVGAGGTVTHHHAVGRVHLPGYEQQVPALFRRALGAVKRELDPEGRLNPGVLGLPLA